MSFSFSALIWVSKSFALYTATLRNAEILGLDKQIGSVEVGKKADLLVVNDDPLKDLHALGKAKLVMVDGNLIKNPKFKRDKKLDSLIDPII